MKAIKPEDILPDNQNTTDIQGQTVRKGTVAAVLANIELFENPDSDEATKIAAIEMIKTLVPSIKAINLNKHMQFRNPEIEALFN